MHLKFKFNRRIILKRSVFLIHERSKTEEKTGVFLKGRIRIAFDNENRPWIVTNVNNKSFYYRCNSYDNDNFHAEFIGTLENRHAQIMELA